jgi:pentatricopeptide repeat protein
VLDELPDGAAAARNAMLSAYARGGRVGDTERLFAGMPDRSVVSWTAMVSGYAQNGRHEEAVVGAKAKTPPFARGLRCSRWSDRDKTGRDTLRWTRHFDEGLPKGQFPVATDRQNSR